MVTEQEVTKNWANLFRDGVVAGTLTKAEELLEQLRPESPLRHRLSQELEEVRHLHARKPKK